MQKLLDDGIYSFKAELARNLGFSRARVTQILNGLKINPILQEYIIALGDPFSSPIVTERKLGSLIDYPCEKNLKVN